MDEEIIRANAESFFQNQGGLNMGLRSEQTGNYDYEVKVKNVTILLAEKSTASRQVIQQVPIYIIQYKDETEKAAGYLVMAGDDRFENKVLMFNDEGQFDDYEQSDFWKDRVNGYIYNVVNSFNEEKIGLRSLGGYRTTLLKIGTSWHQYGSPYNDYAPFRGGDRASVGCVGSDGSNYGLSSFLILNRVFMKQLFIIISGIMFSFGLHAQYTDVPYNLETEFTGVFSETRFTKGDTIYMNVYNAKGEEIPGNSGEIQYRRSKDGLTDTIFHLSGASSIYMRTYSPDGKLITYKDLHYAPVPDNYTLIPYAEQNYSYTADGRIESIVFQSYTSDLESVVYYDYSRNLITKAYKREDKDAFELEELTRIEYTDSGYVATKYIVDIVGKDTTYQLQRTTEYIFDREGRLRRRSNVYAASASTINYSYTNQGYYRNGTIYIFNEDGFIEETKGGEIVRYKYIYNEDNPQSYIPVSTNPQPVYGVDGSIVVTAVCKGSVCIYDINGQLLKEVASFANGQIPMGKGIYIVTVNNYSYKVLVR